MTVRRDKEGFLEELSDWSETVALELAAAEGITLSVRHWELITLAREFYAQFEVSPEMRPLVKRVRERLGADKASSIYLLELFPGSPAKLIAKIAGLPRPTNCL